MPWDRLGPPSPYPDAVEALRVLHRGGFRLGVLANQPASAAEDLARAGIAPLLDGCWLSEPLGLSKPDPAFFRLHGIDPGATRLLANKAKNHFRAAFAERCSAIIECDAPGPAALDLAALPFRHVPAAWRAA